MFCNEGSSEEDNSKLSYAKILIKNMISHTKPNENKAGRHHFFCMKKQKSKVAGSLESIQLWGYPVGWSEKKLFGNRK